MMINISLRAISVHNGNMMINIIKFPFLYLPIHSNEPRVHDPLKHIALGFPFSLYPLLQPNCTFRPVLNFKPGLSCGGFRYANFGNFGALHDATEIYILLECDSQKSKIIF